MARDGGPFFEQTHSYAEIISGENRRARAGFCGSNRCTSHDEAVVFKVEGLGKGVLKTRSRAASSVCPDCGDSLYWGDRYVEWTYRTFKQTMKRHDAAEALHDKKMARERRRHQAKD